MAQSNETDTPVIYGYLEWEDIVLSLIEKEFDDWLKEQLKDLT